MCRLIGKSVACTCPRKAIINVSDNSGEGSIDCLTKRAGSVPVLVSPLLEGFVTKKVQEYGRECRMLTI